MTLFYIHFEYFVKRGWSGINLNKMFSSNSFVQKQKQNCPKRTSIKASRIKRLSRSIQNHCPINFEPCFIDLNMFWSCVKGVGPKIRRWIQIQSIFPYLPFKGWLILHSIPHFCHRWQPFEPCQTSVLLSLHQASEKSIHRDTNCHTECKRACSH